MMYLFKYNGEAKAWLDDDYDFNKFVLVGNYKKLIETPKFIQEQLILSKNDFKVVRYIYDRGQGLLLISPKFFKNKNHLKEKLDHIIFDHFYGVIIEIERSNKIKNLIS